MALSLRATPLSRSPRRAAAAGVAHRTGWTQRRQHQCKAGERQEAAEEAARKAAAAAAIMSELKQRKAAERREFTLLHDAVEDDDPVAVRLLLAQSADPEADAAAKDEDDYTPLFLAAVVDQYETACALLEAAPKSALVPCEEALAALPIHAGEQALHCIDEGRRCAIAKWFSLCSNTASHFYLTNAAAQAGHTRVLSALLNAAPECASMTDSDGRLAATHAADEGHAAALELVLQAAPALAMQANHTGWLPVHHAADEGHTACLRKLLKVAPACAAAPTTSGSITPVHQAALWGHAEALKVLLEAAPSAAAATDANGVTPL